MEIEAKEKVCFVCGKKPRPEPGRPGGHFRQGMCDNCRKKCEPKAKKSKPIDELAPSLAGPGSPAKIAALARRANGENRHLYHPDDAKAADFAADQYAKDPLRFADCELAEDIPE